MQALIAPYACLGDVVLPLLDAATGQPGHVRLKGDPPPGAGWRYLDPDGRPILAACGWAWSGQGRGVPLLRSLVELSGAGPLSCKLRKRGYAICVVTLSDKGSRGERADTAGPAVAAMLSDNLPVACMDSYILPDEEAELKGLLASLAFTQRHDLICTCGGTGVSPRDITPQATAAILDHELPGFGEAMRMASLAKTPNAIVSRAICGVAGQSLILNLPGSLKGATENLAAVLPALAHTLAKLGGDSADCGG